MMNRKTMFGVGILLLAKLSNAVIPAHVDRSNLSLGQSLTLTIDMTNVSDSPDLNTLSNSFDVSGTSTNSQTNIINGHINSQTTLIINLSPKNLGKQAIPPIKIGNDETAPITIVVNQPSPAEQALEHSQVYIDTNIVNTPSYVGVPIIYSVKFYYSVPLANVSMTKFDIPGAQIQPSGQEIRYAANIKNTDYQVIEQRFTITPKQSGTLNIPAIKINGGIVENNTNGIFPIATPKPFNTTSKPLTLTIKPIPNSIPPTEWFPAQQLNLNESWSITTSTFKVGQPITRTIAVQALGIPYTSIPEINFATPNGMNAYPDKTINDNSITDDKLVATKTLKTAYIPTQPGIVVFPEIKIKWWDINSDSLKTSTIPAKTYTIIADANSTMNHTASGSAQKQQVANNSSNISAQHNNLWYYISIALAVLLIATLTLIGILLRKKTQSVIKQNNHEIVPPKLLKENKAYALVHQACQNKDIQTLNRTLIEWASLHWHKNIYTALDIKDLSNNEVLHELIDKLNLALYRDYSFKDFEHMDHIVAQIAKSTPIESKDSNLKDFYPK